VEGSPAAIVLLLWVGAHSDEFFDHGGVLFNTAMAGPAERCLVVQTRSTFIVVYTGMEEFYGHFVHVVLNGHVQSRGLRREALVEHFMLQIDGATFNVENLESCTFIFFIDFIEQCLLK